MTLATHITLFRLATIPVLLFFLLQRTPFGYTLATLLFGLAVLSDVLDGYIARLLRQVSDFGGALDAISDKILILSMLFSLWYIGIYEPIVMFPMFFRDMIVDGLRNELRNRKIHYGANVWGKLKFSLQSLSIFLSLAYCLTNYAPLVLAANMILFLAFLFSLPGLWKAIFAVLGAPVDRGLIKQIAK